jgi:hypothetical protein
MSQHHERFDLARWIREFPMASLREKARIQVEQYAKEHPEWYRHEADKEEHAARLSSTTDMVYGPRQMAVIEQLRAESADRVDRGPGIPADVCVWALGEPTDPLTTKIGGKPYRPSNEPWPVNNYGEPLGLLAQFCFTDSLDILPFAKHLPGDLLLIFTSDPHMYWDWQPDVDDGNWKLEWHSIRSTPHVMPTEVPCVLELTPVHAQLHRTMDYPTCEADDGLNVIWGGKLGGVPGFQQGDPALPGRHLCTLGSLIPVGNPWPLVNVQLNPNGDDKPLDHRLLMLGDVGAAYFFLDEDGRTTWHADCG